MSENGHFKYSNQLIIVPLCAMISIWTVYWAELYFGVNLNSYGVMPRTILGLKGVVFSPFIHGSLEHLYNNTIPLGILLSAVWYFYRDIAWRVLCYGILFSGFLTWCIGRTSYHIGASGLIYVLASFVFFKGIFSQYYRLIALSLIVVFCIREFIVYVFPVKEGISWEGHLSGFLTGLLLARVIRASVPHPKKFAWEYEDYNEDDDPFLKHFDEEGNFIEKEMEVQEKPEELKIRYTYRTSNSEDVAD